MKFYAYITRPEEYLAGDLTGNLVLRTHNDHVPTGWVFVYEVDLPLEEVLDTGALRAAAVEDLEEQIKRAREIYVRDLQELEQRRDDLLAIEYKPQA